MKTNKVANILWIIGIAIIGIGFVFGIINGQQSVEYIEYENSFIWADIFLYWFFSFVFGMLFIGIAEIIEILDTKLSWIQRKMSDGTDVEEMPKTAGVPHLQKVDEEKQKSSTLSKKSGLPLSKQEESFVLEHFEKKGISVKAVFNTPFEDLCLVTFLEGEDKLFDVSGFHPEEVPHKKWNEEMNVWFDNFKNENI